MEWPSFLWNCSLSLLRGLRSLKNWLLKKLSMKVLDQKFWFLVEKWIFWCPNMSRNLIFWTLMPYPCSHFYFDRALKYNFKTSWPQKISIFKKHFTAKITLILMIKKNASNFFGCWKVKYLWTILCLYIWGPKAMRGNNFKEKKVVPLIFMQFWIRSHLNQLDRLTPQDV